MKSRPILFSARMVRALLDGRKTQTRRVIKPDWWVCLDPEDLDDVEQALTMCPFGVPGDRLWVREAWRPVGWSEDFTSATIEYAADSARRIVTPLVDDYGPWVDRWSAALIRQGATEDERGWLTLPEGHRQRWHPSIHMPRWASRLTLEVTDVRVERLQDISEEDACAEGVEPETWGAAAAAGRGHAASFAELWESINGAGSWGADPWVWAVSFKRVGTDVVDLPAATAEVQP